MNNLLKTLVFTMAAPGTVVFLVPFFMMGSRVRAFSLEDWHPLGLLLIMMGLVLYFSSAWNFAVTGEGTPAPIDPPKKFVAKGFYRWTRNPMYVGGFLILAGEALLYYFWPLFIYLLAISIVVNLFVLYYEEPTLRKKFGRAYERYCKEVPRWIPRFNR
jgi:protein-S-isoprenylcysteine O-methyltransferase Ste14